MTNIFLKNNEYEIIDSNYIDENTIIKFVQFNDIGIDKFKNIKDNLFNLGFVSKKEDFTHRLYKQCTILGRSNNELILLFTIYMTKDVNIADYRKNKIKNILKNILKD